MRPVLVVLFISGLIALVIWIRGAGSTGGPEARLLRLCRGNQDQAERLVRGELSREPGISRAEAAARAIDRYERDNR